MTEQGLFERMMTGVERTAAGFLALITALTFISVILRYVFAWSIPDSFDIGRYLLGVVIFWGIAVASFRGEHITVDLVWGLLGPRMRRAMDVFAGGVSLFCLAVFAWMMGGKVLETQATNVQTMDLRLPVWPDYLLAWLGLALAVLLMVVRIVRQVLRPPEGAAERHVGAE